MNGIKKTIKLAEKIDMTKFKDSFVKKVADAKNFDDLPQKIIDDILLIAGTICQARNKGSFTKKECEKATEELYINLLLEANVRKGWMKRIGKWRYDNDTAKYKITKKGEREVKGMGIGTTDTSYIG